MMTRCSVKAVVSIEMAGIKLRTVSRARIWRLDETSAALPRRR